MNFRIKYKCLNMASMLSVNLPSLTCCQPVQIQASSIAIKPYVEHALPLIPQAPYFLLLSPSPKGTPHPSTYDTVWYSVLFLHYFPMSYQTVGILSYSLLQYLYLAWKDVMVFK